MNESPQQYIDRILGNLEGKDALMVLKTTPKKVKKLIKGVKKKNLYRRPAPEKWSVAEIVAHLAETELVLGWRYRSVASNPGVVIQSFEQDDWAKTSRYGKLDIEEMLEMYTVLRKANLKFLAGLPKEKFENYGMHQERGKETIAHIRNMEAGHDLNHFKQIEKILN
ncbi:MAG: DinB family protein [Bacteroidota bacterium]|nr:DinB family protein [Bacteroidota bacterium]